jgi:hypothetical protein
MPYLRLYAPSENNCMKDRDNYFDFLVLGTDDLRVWVKVLVFCQRWIRFGILSTFTSKRVEVRGFF